MTLDIARYRASTKRVLTFVVDRDKDIYDSEGLITNISVATGVPLIAVSHFYMEEYGESEAVKELITRLMRFYGVTEVLL